MQHKLQENWKSLAPIQFYFPTSLVNANLANAWSLGVAGVLAIRGTKIIWVAV